MLKISRFSSFFRERKKKERPEMHSFRQKEERKTVVDFKRLAEKRSHKQTRVFKEHEDAQCEHFNKNARPRFAFSGCLTRKSPKVCYVCIKNSLKIQADRSVRKAGRRAPAGKLREYSA